MKKALKLLLAWFFWLIAGSLIGTFFYCLYLHSLGLIAGSSSPIWTRENLLTSLFTVTQVMAFVSGFLLIAYRIRHRGNPLQLVAFIITQFFSWCLIFPLSTHFEEKYISSALSYSFFESSLEQGNLSVGYFREADDKVYYFLNDDNTNVISIDTSETGTSTALENDWSAYADISRKSLPYKDILIKNSFAAKSFTYSFFGSLRQIGQSDLIHGWTYWLGFLSMALALSSIYALSGFTTWRIANYSICGVLYELVLFYNGFFWSHELTNFRNLPFVNGGFFKYFKTWFSSPFLVFVNLLFALILTVLGTVLFFIKKKRGRLS
ncbi:MAG: hypothetical protein MJ182_07620 [Treponema sp.]|nr:hypothetical protein [Treponema sp.]